jgi:hypothetical protein
VRGAISNDRPYRDHWGYVDASKEEAECCHALAVAIVSILREMDRIKYAGI